MRPESDGSALEERAYLERRARVARGVEPATAHAALVSCAGGAELPWLAPLWHLRSRAAGMSRGVSVWRPAGSDPPRTLAYRAPLPGLGEAELSYSFEPHSEGTRVTQRCVFRPDGLRGRLYWHAVRPAHGLVFGAMLRGAVRLAEARARAAG